MAGGHVRRLGDPRPGGGGPGAAPAAGITLTVGGETVTYGGFTSSVNNDCTITGSGVISVSAMEWASRVR